ncbi:MAG: hypothetical protein UR94_C0006G0001 [Parcubacteria group bacterium GW2011_GWA2_36_10]|nr:MAG: hypothetical protein UR94_C0006G0001 [Parcubacteria group bacterium GW2011_GWA2_36_10]
MNELNFHNTQQSAFKAPPPTGILPILEKTKNVYLLWYSYYLILTKTHKYTLGQKIDNLLLELIENITIASFLKKEEKLPYLGKAMQKLDTLKIMLLILWETKSLDQKKYLNLSLALNEIGKMLGGWNGQLLKQKLS